MISNPEVNCTLATLRKTKFGFFWVIIEKLTNKSLLLPFYRTVHEFFTSYDSSFNSFEAIGSFSSFKNLLPSSTLTQRVTRTNSVTFSCSNWTLSIFFILKSNENIILFTKHMWIKSESYITKDLSRSIPLPKNQKYHFQVWICSFGIWVLLLRFYLLIYLLFLFPFLFFFYSLPSFLRSHRFVLVEFDLFLIERRVRNKSEWYIYFFIKNTMWNLRVFPLPLSLSHRYNIWINREPFLLYLYESILLHFNSFSIPPKENLKVDPKLMG